MYLRQIAREVIVKFFLGFKNIASLYDDLSSGLKELGHEVITFTTEAHPIFSKADYDISIIVQDKCEKFIKENPQASQEDQKEYLKKIEDDQMAFAFQKASEADVCIFFMNTFEPNCEDLDTLKKLGKKVVVVLCGSECRVVSAENCYRKINGVPQIENVQQTFETIKRNLQYLRAVEQKADLVLGVSLAGLRPSSMKFTHIIGCKSIPFYVSDRDIPNVMFAPSKYDRESSAIWLQIFDELKEEGYKFNLYLAENIPHSEFMQSLANMDIVCDNLFIGGKIQREAMAAGCACIAPYSPDHVLKKQYAIKDMEYFLQCNNIAEGSEKYAYAMKRVEDTNWIYDDNICPLIPADVHTAKDKLRELLQNKAMRMEYSYRGRACIEKYCSPVEIVQDMLDCLEAPDDFYSQAKLWNHKPVLRCYEYYPSCSEELAVINETLDIVRDCEWYKRSIKPGCINGINF